MDSESDQLGGDSKHRKTSDRQGNKNDKAKSSEKFQKKEKKTEQSLTKSVQLIVTPAILIVIIVVTNTRTQRQDQTRAAVVTKIMRMPIIRDLGNILRLERNTLNCVLTVHL